MQNSMAVFTFFVFDQKCLFWANLVHTVKIVSLRLNLVASLIRICRIQWCCSLFLFSTGNGLLGKFGPKSQNVSLRWNLIPRLIQIYKYTEFNDAVQFFCFWPAILFFDKFGPKNQNCQFSWTLVPKLIKICT